MRSLVGRRVWRLTYSTTSLLVGLYGTIDVIPMSSLSSSAIINGTVGTGWCLQARELSCHYAAIVALHEVLSNHSMHCEEHSRNVDVP